MNHFKTRGRTFCLILYRPVFGIFYEPDTSEEEYSAEYGVDEYQLNISAAFTVGEVDCCSYKACNTQNG